MKDLGIKSQFNLKLISVLDRTVTEHLSSHVLDGFVNVNYYNSYGHVFAETQEGSFYIARNSL